MNNMQIPKYRYDDNNKTCKGFNVKYSFTMKKWVAGFDINRKSLKQKISDISKGYLGWGNTIDEAIKDFINRCVNNHNNINY